MALGVDRLFRHRQAAWLTLVVGLALTAALGWEMYREAVHMDQQRLTLRVAEIKSQLDARIEKTEMLLLQLQDYLMLSGESRDQIFEQWCYTHGISINIPWLHGIAVATNRNQAQWLSQHPKPPEACTPADVVAFLELARSQPVEFDIALTSEVQDKK